MALHVLHPQVLNVIDKMFWIIFQWSWQVGDVPEERKRENFTPFSMKEKREDLGNYRSVSLHLIPRKVLETVLLESIFEHMKDKKMIWTSQHEFTKGISFLTNLIAFQNEVTILVDKRRVVDVVYLDFNKASDTVSLNIIDKLKKHGLHNPQVRWTENWLNDPAQWVVISGTKCSWRPVLYLRG